MTKKVLILGGTREARQLASGFDGQGMDVTTSLAGRTKQPEPVKGKTRVGGFGGAKGLANYLTENRIELLVDATHPFAKQISANAVRAAKLARVELEVHTRPPWQQRKGDNWTETASHEDACKAIPPDARVLLALGSQHIKVFGNRDDVFYLVRMVDQPETPLSLPNHELVLGKPSSDWREEKKFMEEHQISHIVCRNSGGSGAYAKIEAARNLGLPVIMIGR